MILVGVVAIALGLSRWASEMGRRRAYYQSLAIQHARWEAIHRKTSRGWKRHADDLRSSARPGDHAAEREIRHAQRNSEDSAKVAARLTWLRETSERLATHPWERLPAIPKSLPY
jgi:hypothetical protein